MQRQMRQRLVSVLLGGLMGSLVLAGIATAEIGDLAADSLLGQATFTDSTARAIRFEHLLSGRRCHRPLRAPVRRRRAQQPHPRVRLAADGGAGDARLRPAELRSAAGRHHLLWQSGVQRRRPERLEPVLAPVLRLSCQLRSLLERGGGRRRQRGPLGRRRLQQPRAALRRSPDHGPSGGPRPRPGHHGGHGPAGGSAELARGGHQRQ